MDIKIIRNKNPKSKGDMNNLGFGRYFTDHMFVMDYEKENGWFAPRIVPYGPFEIYPSSSVLNYAPEIFEGMKAFRTAEGRIQLFRPMENIKRMNISAQRMSLPQIDEKLFMEALIALVNIDSDWVPTKPFSSLYIRPILFGNDAKLGVHAPEKCVFTIILSPFDSYFKEGINPVKMMIEPEDVRAVRGGTGFAKCGGNYAGSFRASEKAAEMGYSQVLWLDALERRYVEEGGSMNVMFKINGTVVTPELGESVLDGVTRKSILQLIRDRNIPVEERRVSVDEIKTAVRNGTMEECWCCGTAAVISPIGLLGFDGEEFVINDFKTGELTASLYKELTDIQWGRVVDTRNWIYKI